MFQAIGGIETGNTKDLGETLENEKSELYPNTKEAKSIPLDAKPLLTLKEASIYTGIGINKLREMSNENSCDYVLFVGRKRMFKREALLRFLKEAYSV